MQVNACMSNDSQVRDSAIQINDGNVSFPPKSVFAVGNSCAPIALAIFGDGMVGAA
jgi:hypothetical protein